MRVPRDISDPIAKAAKYEEFKMKAIPFYLRNLDNVAKLNKGYLGCSKVSVLHYLIKFMIIIDPVYNTYYVIMIAIILFLFPVVVG